MITLTFPVDDCIVISELELFARIGITEEERATPQRLTVSLQLYPKARLFNLDDNIANTVDYATVRENVQSVASAFPRNLLETLAEGIAINLLAVFPLQSVELELRKYILPDAAYTAIQIRRP